MIQYARREGKTSSGATGMQELKHEVWDPIHGFIHYTDDERDLINSPEFQRLRHIHQLGMSHFLFPSANHTRFEHSLGVMHLATELFDAVTEESRIPDVTQPLLSDGGLGDRNYWRAVVRLAALCHDVGHPPFSHAPEELLPKGKKHEHLTKEIVLGELSALLASMGQKPKPEDVAFVALGAKLFPEKQPEPWEELLCSIVTGDVFGADRIDYLLRDSYHVGVPNGTFDYKRLIETIRVLPSPPEGEGDEPSKITLGVDQGGLHAAEALLVSRYFMYSQVYFHPLRRVYDVHLRDFMVEEGFQFSDAKTLLTVTDDDVVSCWLSAARSNAGDAKSTYARRIAERQHFKLVDRGDPRTKHDPRTDRQKVYEALVGKYGQDMVRQAHVPAKTEELGFSVLREREGDVASAHSLSQLVENMPTATVDYVYVHPDVYDEATEWLGADRETIVGTREEEREDG